MKENLNDIYENLVQIHSLALVLFGAYEKHDNIDECFPNARKNPVLSISEIIMEKSEICLEKVDLIEFPDRKNDADKATFIKYK